MLFYFLTLNFLDIFSEFYKKPVQVYKLSDFRHFPLTQYEASIARG
jgi:hypothetical protein